VTRSNPSAPRSAERPTRSLHLAILLAMEFVARGALAADNPQVHLTPTASSVDVNSVVTIVVTSSNLPTHAIVVLQQGKDSEFWVGTPDCQGASRLSRTLAASSAPTLLCLTSRVPQTLRAVTTVASANTTPFAAASDPVKFSGDPWYKNSTVTGTFLALAGALFGLVSTLAAQNFERSKKNRDETRALMTEQSQFLTRSLLPELSNHLTILATNEALTDADCKKVASLPKTNAINIVSGSQADTLAAYFRNVNLRSVLLSKLQQYTQSADAYNTEAEKARRQQVPMSDLTKKGQEIRTALAELGFRH